MNTPMTYIAEKNEIQTRQMIVSGLYKMERKADNGFLRKQIDPRRVCAEKDKSLARSPAE